MQSDHRRPLSNHYSTHLEARHEAGRRDLRQGVATDASESPQQQPPPSKNSPNVAWMSSFWQSARRLGELTLPPSAVVLIGVWIISPRFSITGPSLIDDWKALVSTPADMHAFRFSYHIAEARFRPAWIVWNWVQWRVPGAPGKMLGPNLLGVARLALLVAGMTMSAWLLVRHAGRGLLEQAIFCSLPALIVITMPAFAEDLARFGPEEPALVGGMLLGGALMYRGGCQLALEPGRSLIRAYCWVILGFIVWCYGVFQKETSVCVLLAFALAVPLGRGLRQRLTARQLRIASILVAIASAPVLAMLFEVARIVQAGSLAYGAHVKAGAGAMSAFGDAIRMMHSETHSRLGFVLLVVVLAGVVVSLWRRRPDWLQLALLVIALAALEMTAQTEVFASRYYLPSIALLALGAARAVSFLPRGYARAIVAGTSILIVISAGGAHSNVSSWASGDQLGDDLVTAVQGATHRGCHLTVAGVDPERTLAIEALVRYPDGPGSCAGLPRYALLGPSPARLPGSECAATRRTQLGEWRVGNAEPIQFVRCGPN